MTGGRRYEQEEINEAAREAGDIGGRVGDDALGPAARPVDEAGGGVAEGFEKSLEALIDHASHGDQQAAHAILHDQGRAEEQNTAQDYAEADHERSSELEDNELDANGPDGAHPRPRT
jgi:hypothetical protein